MNRVDTAQQHHNTDEKQNTLHVRRLRFRKNKQKRVQNSPHTHKNANYGDMAGRKETNEFEPNFDPALNAAISGACSSSLACNEIEIKRRLPTNGK